MWCVLSTITFLQTNCASRKRYYSELYFCGKKLHNTWKAVCWRRICKGASSVSCSYLSNSEACRLKHQWGIEGLTEHFSLPWSPGVLILFYVLWKYRCHRHCAVWTRNNYGGAHFEDTAKATDLYTALQCPVKTRSLELRKRLPYLQAAPLPCWTAWAVMSPCTVHQGYVC
jgi:hypothetical protein